MLQTLPEGGLVHLPPWVRVLRILDPQDPIQPPGARTWQLLGCRDLKWPPEAGTRLGVQNLERAPGARTQVPPHLLTPSWGPRPGTQTRLQMPPLALGVTVALVTL
jgi:hypothetical protein